jgi:exoribonuclease-2
VEATLLRENLVKLDNMPLVFKVPSLPELPAGSRVRLAVVAIDLLDLNLQSRFIAPIEDTV